MKRIIEELIHKRKESELKMEEAFQRLADNLESRSGWRREKGKTRKYLSEALESVKEWTLAQDREWDVYASNHATTVFKSLQWKIDRLEADYASFRHLLLSFIRLEKLLDRLLQSLEAGTPLPDADQIRSLKEQLSVFQYSAFEARFRGSPENIQKKLAGYLRWFETNGPVLDIGCGRGEFLSLLQERGIEALGIDLSDSMLNQAREKGYDCIQGDALEFLQKQKSDSLGGIFSSQVIEHFPADYLRRIVQESYRVLRPGSILLMETLNPLSLFSLSRIYFLDPTHVHPYHPEYMRYLLETSGFSEVQTLFVSEPEEDNLRPVPPETPAAAVLNQNLDRLNDLLFAASEYAIQGKKR